MVRDKKLLKSWEGNSCSPIPAHSAADFHFLQWLYNSQLDWKCETAEIWIPENHPKIRRGLPRLLSAQWTMRKCPPMCSRNVFALKIHISCTCLGLTWRWGAQNLYNQPWVHQIEPRFVPAAPGSSWIQLIRAHFQPGPSWDFYLRPFCVVLPLCFPLLWQCLRSVNSKGATQTPLGSTGIGDSIRIKELNWNSWICCHLIESDLQSSLWAGQGLWLLLPWEDFRKAGDTFPFQEPTKKARLEKMKWNLVLQK